MLARRAEIQLERLIPIGHPYEGLTSARIEIGEGGIVGPVGLAAVAVHRYPGRCHAPPQRGRAGIVRTNDQGTTRLDAGRERAEGRRVRLVGPVEVEVIDPTFVTTAISGENATNVPSLSSTSAMKTSSAPTWALVPEAISSPPMA